MKGSLDTEPYKGVRDFYPRDWDKLSALFGVARATLSAWGYEEYQASPLERAELYESKGNEEIIREQTYTFEDRAGRRVTLRPEMTPSLARMVAGKRRELTFPLRWFSIGNRFRYERPQRGRLREFFQTDVDLIGLPEGEADLEILMLAHTLMQAFGASSQDFTIRINSRALLSRACEAVGLTDEEGVRAYWQLLDKKSKMSAQEFEKARGNTPDPLKAVEEATDAKVKAEKEKVFTLIETLNSRGVTNVSFDAEIVRGFDYYTGMVFEVNDTSAENPRALFGGGRYDGLVSMFGGDSIPAVGFAFGDVTLMDFLETHRYELTSISRPQLFIATPRVEDIPYAQAFATTLRKEVRVFVNLSEKKVGDQIKEADKRGVPLVMVYGKDEETGTTLMVKELETGTEHSLSKATAGVDIAQLLSR